MKDTIYFNEEGQLVDFLDIEQEACNRIIEFCASVIVPDGFTYEFTNFDSFSICSDLSNLVCVERLEEVQGTAPNPCGGTITCQFFLNAVRVIGTARFLLNIGDLTPDTPGIHLGPPCRLCLDETLAVNQLLGYRCPDEDCPEDCIRTIGAGVTRPSILVDGCGRQIVSVSGRLFLAIPACG